MLDARARAAGRGGARRRALVRDVPADRDVLRACATSACRSRADFALDAAAHARRDRRAPAGARLHRVSEQSDRQPVRRARRSSASLDAAPGLVVVDEAYHAFAGGRYAADELAQAPEPARHAHAVEARARGPAARARRGRRASGSRELEKVRLPYNVNVLTQLVAEEVLRASTRCSTSRRRRSSPSARGSTTSSTRMPRRDAVSERRELHPVRVPDAADATFDGLKERGVLVKNLHGSHPAARRTACGVTVGTRDENDRFLAALARIDRSTPDTMPHAKPKSPRNTLETQISVKLDLDGTRRARASRLGCRSSTTCSTRSRATASFDLDVERAGRPAHRRAPHRRGHRHHARAGVRARRSATRRACAATATPTCRSTRRCRASWSTSPAGRGSSSTSTSCARASASSTSTSCTSSSRASSTTRR